MNDDTSARDFASGLIELCEAVLEGRAVMHDVPPAFAVLARTFRSLGDRERDEVRARVGARHASALWAIAALSVESALRTSDPGLLEDAFTAHAIESFRLDWRDSLLGLAALWFAIDHLGVPERDITRHEVLFSEAGREKLARFRADPAYLRSLKSFGLEAISGPEGIELRALPPKPTPKA